MAKAYNKIKCTYEDCFKHFPSIEAMKKHKAKDEIHDYYCKKCDYDGTDDTWLLYHQITSPKHICCPVCGRDFKSEGGRDRHVDIEHLPKQTMNCAGCEMSFSSASSLMAHIEENQCPVISRMHFYRQRAERQITKDAWQNAEDPTAGTTIMSDAGGSRVTRTEPTLLDDDQAWIEMDWAGNPVNHTKSKFSGSDPSTIADQMPSLSMEKYPPLGPRNSSQAPTLQGTEGADEDLLDLEPGTGAARLPMNHIGSANLGTTRSNPPAPADNRPWSEVALFSSGFSDAGQSAVTAQSFATYRTAPAARTESVLLHTERLGDDTNAQVKTVTQIPLPSHLEIDKYWDPLSEKYACPGRKCGQRFASIDSFKAHLLSDAHVYASVTCPGCYKRFKTTTGLIAHCESASRKCKIRHALDYDMVIRQITAGMISADGYQEDGSIKYTAQKIEDW